MATSCLARGTEPGTGGHDIRVGGGEEVAELITNKRIGPLTGFAAANGPQIKLTGALTIKQTANTTFYGYINSAAGSLTLDPTARPGAFAGTPFSNLTKDIEAWAAKNPEKFPNYVAGSWGPECGDHLLERMGHRWRNDLGRKA